jgi:hypothetical protein
MAAPTRPSPACTLEHVLCNHPDVLKRLLTCLPCKEGQGALRASSSALRAAVDRSQRTLPYHMSIPGPHHPATLRALLRGIKRGCRPTQLDLSFLCATQTQTERAWRQDAL